MITINPKNIPTAKLHSYLLSAVAPRPIAFASTMDKDGNPNLSPFSFFNVFSANPPILIFSPARRGRDNTTKHTFENIKEVKEVVINVVNYAIAQQMSLSSTEYAKGINEFEKAGFTMLPSEEIKPFRVAESPIQFECKVNEIIELGTEGGAGNLIICEVLKMHIDENILDEDGTINQEKLDLIARAGGSYYSRAKKGFFEIPKPLQKLGIGVDKIPDEIKKSNILTGNNLGMLANVEAMPNTQDVDNFAKDNPNYIGLKTEEKHKFAQEFLENNDVLSAWKVLLIK
ncbi:flavin reductase family protein [Aureibaculum sp. 2210JD6-5]|uniref:flavin reductase family protein n=1 Tax=Aureibaculum sp. 2210JD6-5 TaxID=3103957 RepID=UPI002AAD74EC|nr:flavin reductase family protein [Aureibaculum sp. 2210JD6-5]MDY7396395.1 flavin reductase family protein [Aureibaculum sp. 2210JD6-5]